jgi:hypothetical protein
MDICLWGLLGVDGCIQVFGGVWGSMEVYFWGLLGVDGCVQMFGGVRRWLSLCVFPLFAYYTWFQWVRFVLLNVSPLVGPFGEICSAKCFTFGWSIWWEMFCLIFHLWWVHGWELFCILNRCDNIQLFCILGLGDVVRLFCGMSFVCPHSPSTVQQLVFWTGVLGISGLVQPWQWCICSSTILGHPFEGEWPPLSLGTKVYALRLHLAMETGR